MNVSPHVPLVGSCCIIGENCLEGEKWKISLKDALLLANTHTHGLVDRHRTAKLQRISRATKPIKLPLDSSSEKHNKQLTVITYANTDTPPL